MDEALIKTYNAKGITHDNDTLKDPDNPDRYREMPILGDLYDILLIAPETKRLANILNRLVHGSASTFNQRTNVNLDNKYTVLDISELSGDLLTAGMFVALDYVWDKAKQNRTVEKTIFIDECWALIGGSANRLAANFVLEIAKIIRGYGGSAVLLRRTSTISLLSTTENTAKASSTTARPKSSSILKTRRRSGYRVFYICPRRRSWKSRTLSVATG